MAVDVPFRVARHVILFPDAANALVSPTVIDFHVTPSSFDTSISIDVPVGMYPIALCNFISSTFRLAVVVFPRMVVLVVVGALSSKTAPSPHMCILRETLLQYDV